VGSVRQRPGEKEGALVVFQLGMGRPNKEEWGKGEGKGPAGLGLAREGERGGRAGLGEGMGQQAESEKKIVE
jgi:hypothetical protein